VHISYPSSPPPPVFKGGIPALDATFAEFAGLPESAAADDHSGESEKGSAGNSFHNPEIDPADGLHDSSCAVRSIPAGGNVDSTVHDGIDGERTEA